MNEVEILKEKIAKLEAENREIRIFAGVLVLLAGDSYGVMSNTKNLSGKGRIIKTMLKSKLEKNEAGIVADVKGLVDTLEQLARLGSPRGGYGNSIGNEIAVSALKKWSGQFK